MLIERFVQVWDVLRGEKVGSLTGHESRISCLGVSNDGIGLCTGSWDSLVSGCPLLLFDALDLASPPFGLLLTNGLQLKVWAW